MNLEKLDKIIVNKEQIEDLVERAVNLNSENIVFPLNEGLIIIEEKGNKNNHGLGLHFKIVDENKGCMTIALNDLSSMRTNLKVEIDEEYYINRNLKSLKDYYGYGLGNGEEKLYQVIRSSVKTVISVLDYMAAAKEEIIVTEESKPISKVQKKKKKSRGNKNRITYVTTKQYVIDYDKKSQEIDKRNYSRQTEAWTVRGHWRYIKKTGKKVWVNAHKKGQGDAQGKVYKV
jgi:hypothetical protein